jgi:hypothetical protein
MSDVRYEKREYPEIEGAPVEHHYSIENANGLSVADLYALLGTLMFYNPQIAKVPVCLCLPGVESSTTVIVRANNEGDDQTVWLHLEDKLSDSLSEGIGADNFTRVRI